MRARYDHFLLLSLYSHFPSLRFYFYAVPLHSITNDYFEESIFDVIIAGILFSPERRHDD